MSTIVDAVVVRPLCRKKVFIGLILEVEVAIEEMGGLQTAQCFGVDFPIHLVPMMEGIAVSVLIQDSTEGQFKKPRFLAWRHQGPQVMSAVWSRLEEGELSALDQVPWHYEISKKQRDRLEKLLPPSDPKEPPPDKPL